MVALHTQEFNEAELGQGHVAQDDDGDAAHQGETVDRVDVDDNDDVKDCGEGGDREGEVERANFSGGGEDDAFDDECGGEGGGAEVHPEEDGVWVGEGVTVAVVEGVLLGKCGGGEEEVEEVGKDEEEEDAEADGDPGFGEADGGGGELLGNF